MNFIRSPFYLVLMQPMDRRRRLLPLFHLLLDHLSHGSRRQTAQRGLPKLLWHPMAHVAHTVDDLIHRDPALDAHVPLHTGPFPQPRHRIADKSHQIFQSHSGGMSDLLRAAAPDSCQRSCRHGRRRADLRLASAGGAGNAGPICDNSTDARRHVQSLHDFLLRHPLAIQGDQDSTPQAPAVGAATIFRIQALDSAVHRARVMT